MSLTINPAPVRKSVLVSATPERAFEVFTAGIDRWWPREKSIGDAPMRQAVLEPGDGGRWYTILEDGSRCDWGDVLVWEPPRRLVLAWRIRGDWGYDPALLTEIEVTFAPEAGGVRVVLEHRLLENMGPRGEQSRAAFDDVNGWASVLRLYAAEAAQPT